jgi:hypothetical protein
LTNQIRPWYNIISTHPKEETTLVLIILLVMSLLLGTGHFYLARRTRYYLSPLSRRFPRKLYNGFFILSTLLMAIGFARSMLPIPQALRNLLSVINAYHMAIFVCLLVFIVLLDLLLLLGRLIHLIPHPHYKSVRIA